MSGHTIGFCGIKADGRVRPDEHDWRAAEMVDRLTNRGGRRSWISAVEARRLIARELRLVERRHRKELDAARGGTG